MDFLLTEWVGSDNVRILLTLFLLKTCLYKVMKIPIQEYPQKCKTLKCLRMAKMKKPVKKNPNRPSDTPSVNDYEDFGKFAWLFLTAPLLNKSLILSFSSNPSSRPGAATSNDVRVS